MRYLRCECGKAEYWDGGMLPQSCQGCEECNTTFGGSPLEHKPLEPHDWKPRYNQNTGVPDRRMCKRCMKIEKVKPA